ncbi:uncharacterized protein LOC142239796 [Haematobia irritans]|uniref:uncharacterized protein LOC142239796 n=1 Tax=Haematobia irritans TaxID=7368 RepID=UPI003F4FCEDE
MPSFKYSIHLLGLYLFTLFYICKSEAPYPDDTYINALQTSHLTDTDPNTDFGGYNYSPPSNNQYLPPTTPVPIYGPPAPVYGPPSTIYGPPQPYYKPIFPPHPRDHFSLLEKLKAKINLFTIGKIILKLLIFKKIVKFIGIICLLLFLPKLKGLFKEDMSMDEDSTESKQVETEKDTLEKQVEETFEFVMNAFKKFNKNAEF